MESPHGISSWNLFMESFHGISSWNLVMESLYRIPSWNLYDGISSQNLALESVILCFDRVPSRRLIIKTDDRS